MRHWSRLWLVVWDSSGFRVRCLQKNATGVRGVSALRCFSVSLKPPYLPQGLEVVLQKTRHTKQHEKTVLHRLTSSVPMPSPHLVAEDGGSKCYHPWGSAHRVSDMAQSRKHWKPEA